MLVKNARARAGLHEKLKNVVEKLCLKSSSHSHRASARWKNIHIVENRFNGFP